MMEFLLVAGLMKPCLITGAVVVAPGESKATLSAGCPVEYKLEGSIIRLRSKRWIVEIAVPEETGVQSFRYRWGQSDAIIGDHVVKVSYGPAGGV